ncbi:uncharacterized protein LY79DRAFT_414893 [Colletotrichum navitas]|uniref:Uncharacterized protein n=1 Tax=Colletotrichum navitas TaxID=681940 RepID=A0AAD8PNA8_9PEZI|nr:uncharacterized protein LY79DRAFT_414893 [Colletotrichum navitas]KAK1573277.1 hypothetical protein LY79DRAFT_414893 [Colletotrichum navitas]
MSLESIPSSSAFQKAMDNSPESVFAASKRLSEPVPLDKMPECPVCALKARMSHPDRNPACGHQDYPTDRLINLILKYIPPGPRPVWNKAEELAICRVVSAWCGRSDSRRFTTLRLCGQCHGNHIGHPFRDGWLLNSALPSVEAPRFVVRFYFDRRAGSVWQTRLVKWKK